MNHTSGIVFEVTKRYVIVLCDDGLFRNLPLPDAPPRVGERIRVEFKKTSSGGRKDRVFIWSVLALATLVFLAAIFVWYRLPPM